MHLFSTAVALLVALAIIGIGLGYLIRPLAMAPSFGLPHPPDDANAGWWLRLKGIRDVASGVLVLAFLATDGHRALGLALLIAALIPLGDMSAILAAKGRIATALGVHGVTAALMLMAAAYLLAAKA